MAYFQNIKPGQMVTYLAHNGLRRDGSIDYVERKGRALKLLCFTSHVVVNAGKGRPQVVDDGNFVR